MNKILKCHYGATIAIAVEGDEKFLNFIDNIIASSDRGFKKHDHVYDGVYCISPRRISKRVEGYKRTIRHRSAVKELERLFASYFYGKGYVDKIKTRRHHCRVHGNRYKDLPPISSFALYREAISMAKNFVARIPCEQFMGNMQADFTEGAEHSHNEGYN